MGATFVLVHGAMHGGWCWSDVAARLRADGHDVHTPTLTGQGDRRHQLTPDVELATHVDDIGDLLWFEDLTDVHLVLHSYAGILAGPVAEAAADRLASITYLGAFLAEPGECLLDVEPPATADRYRSLAAESGDGWRVPASGAFLVQWGVTDPALVARVAPRLVDFPFRCVTDVVRYDPAVLAGIAQHYIRHTDPPLPSLDASFDRAVAAGWPTHDIACGHDVMLAAPDELAAVLATIAQT